MRPNSRRRRSSGVTAGRTHEAYRHDLRGYFQWAADNAVEVDAPANRAVPRADGGSRARGVDDRPATFHGVPLLPVRSRRWPHRLQPGPVCPTATSASHRRTRPGPLRAGRVPVHGRAVRPRARRPCLAAWSQRAAGERSMRHQRRRSRCRARPSNAADRREGQQAGDYPARASNRSHRRPGCRRAPRGADPATTRWPTVRSSNRPSLGPFDRQARWARQRSPAHAPSGVHMAALDAGVPLRDVQIAARHADLRTTTIYGPPPPDLRPPMLPT
jgi:hypothetical protein